MKIDRKYQILHSETECSQTSQYLSFKLDGENFALAIAKVREILDFTSVTRVPQVPPYMRGVINLRGAVVPVMDLRLKFGMAAAETRENNCIIIVEIEVDGEIAILGALADSVQEVLDLEAAQIEPPPRIGTRLRTDFIRGMGKQGDEFIIILDIDKVFAADELSLAIEFEPNSEATEMALAENS